MKFSVEKALSSGGRLGLITQASKCGNITLETPMCTLFTKGGSAPHLHMDMLKRVALVPDVAAMSLGSLADHHESVAEFGKGLGEFAAMKNKLVFTTLHDASLALATGKNDNSGVAVWGKGGKIKLDTALFMKVQEAFQPDWFQAMSDGDTDRECGQKRLHKSVDRTLDFLDEIVEKMQNSQILSKSSLIGVIEGGFSEVERVRSAKETALRPVQGFLIEGFEKGNSGKDLFSHDTFSNILTTTIKCLPEDKPRMMETVWSPLQVIKAFRLGIDVFSSAYPHTLAEQGLALVADYSLPPSSQAARLELGCTNPCTEDQTLYTDLNIKFFLCFTMPNFARGCILCFTMPNFPKGHNFHQYFDFFHHLRKAVLEDKLDELEQSLEQQNGNK
ncbi:unnamed protein product [Candidula unifasciata]|uniref:tRNA-guanine(15) transglycosylase-like domain-containing protein n=1 Tax=Candidula unifasciata TaxID=100452 RepID=A0A8S3YI92_9EUPU|nr:unnamed protein product [Candidula unifasciata]